MAQAAKNLGLKYLGIGDHSQSLTVANGLSPERVRHQQAAIDALNKKLKGIRLFKGIECDILGDGALDLSDAVLDEMDIVIGSVHSHFGQPPEQMTDRLLAAIGTGKLDVLGHPFGRMLLRREGYSFDLEQICNAAKRQDMALEHNASPSRLDLNDVHLRFAKSKGVKIIINTDAHSFTDYQRMKYGILQLRRAWLTKEDVVNTRPKAEFLAWLKSRRG